MVNQSLVNYLAEGIRRGFDISLLKNKLLAAGFKNQDVEEASSYVLNQSKPAMPLMPKTPTIPTQSTATMSFSQSQPQKLGLFRKIGKAFIHPITLFESTQDEGIWPALKYQFVLLLVPFIVISVLIFALFQVLLSFFTTLGIPAVVLTLVSSLFSTFSLVFIAFFAITILIAVPILTFLGVVIMHLFVKIFGGNGTYKDTYKALVYSSTPSILLGFIPFVNIAVSVWSFILAVYALSIAHKISKLRAFFILITPLIIIIVLFIVLYLSGFFTVQTVLNNFPA